MKIMGENKQKIIIGISGASGVIYGIRLLQLLADSDVVETHLVMSKAAQLTISQETDYAIKDVNALANHTYSANDIGAAIASGSFLTDGMIVAPCSIRTMSSIATGVTDNLLTRSADVILKEQRKLVLMVRESPFHLGHLRTMTQLAEIGAVIAPPLPAFYPNPSTLDDIINHSVGKVLDMFNIDMDVVKRWEGITVRV